MKIKDIQNAICSQYSEREEVIEGLVVAMIARQHALLIGPPGTGKSALVSDLTSRITGANYFQWLLTRFSTPEELFGPVSLKDLEQGIYRRNTNAKLPEAHVSYLDEIFKGNSAILNALLTLINERIFYNNGGIAQSPLMSLIGSSNEYPEEGEGLEALFDRFLIRFEVNYIGEDKSFVSMLKGAAPSPADMTLEELFQLQFYSDTVTIPEEVFDTLARIRSELKDEGIHPSDRRFKQSLSVIRAKAVLDGRGQAVREDILLLKNSLWERPEQRGKVAEIVRKHAQDAAKIVIEDAMKDVGEIIADLKVVRSNETSTEQTERVVEAAKKIKMIVGDLEKERVKYPEKDQYFIVAITSINDRAKEIANQALGV